MQRKTKWLLWLIPIILVILVISGIGIYLEKQAGIPAEIEKAYQARDCQALVKQKNEAEAFYPTLTDDYPQFREYVDECELFAQGMKEKESKNWESALDLFFEYEMSYPLGVFAESARAEQVNVLLGWVDSLKAEKRYAEATSKLEDILYDFGDVNGAVEQAQPLYPELLAAWGTELRSAQQLSEAEAKFRELENWAKEKTKQEYVTLAQKELAQNHFEIAKQHQGKGEFAAALTHLEKAIQLDPKPDAPDGPAPQAKNAMVTLHTAWAEALFAQKDTKSAIEHYHLAISASPADKKAEIQDMLANLYIQVGTKLAAKEDFLGAIDQYLLAKEQAATETLKSSIEKTQTDLYAVFSKSSDEQAQQAIKTAVADYCNNGKTPQLPIFAQSPDKKQAVASGDFLSLPDDMVAKTPGDLYYIVCAEKKVSVLQSRYVAFRDYDPKYRVTVPAGGRAVVRDQTTWNLKVFAIATQTMLNEKSFTGSTPGPFGFSDSVDISREAEIASVHGDPPKLKDVVDWLLSLLK